MADYQSQSNDGQYQNGSTSAISKAVRRKLHAYVVCCPLPAQRSHHFPLSFVGFANLPNQVHRKSVRKGFQFTCMVVGMYLPSVDFPRFSLTHPPSLSPKFHHVQVNLDWESLRSLTRSSILLSMRQRKFLPPALNVQRLSPSRASVLVSFQPFLHFSLLSPFFSVFLNHHPTRNPVFRPFSVSR